MTGSRLWSLASKVIVFAVFGIWIGLFLFEKAVSLIPSRQIKKLIGKIYDGDQGRCYNCGVPKAYTLRWHRTRTGSRPYSIFLAPRIASAVFGTGYYSGDADSPLCEHCWRRLSESARLSYYLLWVVNHRFAIERHHRMKVKHWRDKIPVSPEAVRLDEEAAKRWVTRLVHEEAEPPSFGS